MVIAEYLFNNGTAGDTSAHGLHGVIHGATPVVDRFANTNGALQFDGVNDCVTISPPPQFSAAAFAISVWARFDARDLKWWTNCIVAQDNGYATHSARNVRSRNQRNSSGRCCARAKAGNFILTKRGAQGRFTRRSLRSQLGAAVYALRRLLHWN